VVLVIIFFSEEKGGFLEYLIIRALEECLEACLLFSAVHALASFHHRARILFQMNCLA